MKDIRLTKKVLEMLAQDLKKNGLTPVGAHLSDLDYAFYADDLLSPADVERVEQHLKTCYECAKEMEEYVTWCEEQRRQEALREWWRSRALKGVTDPPGPAEEKSSPDAEERLAKLQKAVEDFLTKANTVPPWESSGAVWGQMCMDLNIARIDSLGGKKP